MTARDDSDNGSGFERQNLFGNSESSIDSAQRPSCGARRSLGGWDGGTVPPAEDGLSMLTMPLDLGVLSGGDRT
jgi:hypothetical protein